MINPSIVIQRQLEKASQLAIIMIRGAIHTSRARKFNQIDLRTLRAYPEKKKRIRAIIIQNQLVAMGLLSNMLIISSQPIQTRSFPKGGEIVNINRRDVEKI